MTGPDLIGIDLGTTFSAMAVVDKFGKPTIVPNAEGHPTTPSVIHFYDRDACVVGEEAVKMAVVDPTNVVRFIKRSMGEADFSLEFFGMSYTPQELSAIILKKLKEDAEEALGNEVKDAVITVPAYFNSSQRGATAEAGTIAGFNVLSIINEPTTAAIAYGIERMGGNRRLLVFDLGGGTFDVTVMELSGISFKTIASDGNAELGGKDWDDRLLNHAAEQFVEKFGIDPRDDPQPYQELYERCLHAKISLSTKPRAVIPVNFRGHRMVVNVTREEFEHMSRDLVDQCSETCNIVLEKAGLSWPRIDEVLLVGGSTRMPMIRECLRQQAKREPAEGVNPDECVSLGAALAGVLRHRPKHPALMGYRQQLARKAKGDATSSSPFVPTAPQETPLAAAAIEPRRGKAAPTMPPSDDESATAVGPIPLPIPLRPPIEPSPVAAESPEVSVADDDDGPPILGALPPVEISDATTHPLGIVVLDKDLNERIVNLIPESTTVPCEKRGRFAYAFDNMTAVRVEVTEGHGRSREEVKVVGMVVLERLPPRPRGTPIDVVYRYNVNQILEVDVVDVETKTVRRARMDLKGGMDEARLAEARANVSRAVVK